MVQALDAVVETIPAPPLMAHGETMFVLPDKPEEMKGSIHIPKESLEHKRTGTVVAVGPDVVGFAPGDRVILLGEYHSAQFEYEGVVYFLKTANEIAATVLSERSEVIPWREN